MPIQQLIQSTDDFYYSTSPQDFEKLFSLERVQSIKGQDNYKRYFEDLKALYPAIYTIEIVLRNKIDSAITQHRPHWIVELYLSNTQVKQSDIVGKMKEKIKKELIKEHKKPQHITKYPIFFSSLWNQADQSKRDQIHHCLVSRLNLGFWIMILQNKKTLEDIFENISLSFANIAPQLGSFLASNKGKKVVKLHYKYRDHYESLAWLDDEEKTIIFLSFITSIRNRLMHCEFLFKNTESITTKYRNKRNKRNKPFYFSLKDTRKNIANYLKTILEYLK